MPGCEIVEKNIQLDHIHMVMIIPPKYAVSGVIGRVKGLLERERGMVTRIFCFDSWCVRGANSQVRAMARASGFRPSEA